MQCKVSVIIAMHNTEAYIESCLRSVAKQTFKAFEIIAVDDGSTDQTLEKAQSVAKKLICPVQIITQENEGLGGARNTGLKYASGDYVLFLDSDDTLAENALKELYNACERVNADIAICDFLEVDVQEKIKTQTAEALPKQPTSLQQLPSLLLTRVSACNKLFRKSLFFNYNIFFPKYLWYEDMATVPKLLLQANQVIYVPKGLYCYLQRQGSITKTKDSRKNQDIITAINGSINYYKQRNQLQTYRQEFCFLSLWHVYIAASVRVIMIDENKAVLSALADYHQSQFPDYRNNPYIDRLSKQQKIILYLLEKKKYKWIKKLFQLKRIFK